MFKQTSPHRNIQIVKSLLYCFVCGLYWLDYSLYSVILTEYIRIEPRVSVCACVCVCVSMCESVCLFKLYSRNGSADFSKNSHKYSLGYLPVPFFSNFENLNLMMSWRPFYTLLSKNSHVFTVASFSSFSDIWFAIEFQQIQLIISIQNSGPRFGP